MLAPVTAAEYAAWRRDPARDPHRVTLVQLDYARGVVTAGHGRRNEAATLNPVFELLARTYRGTPGRVEVTYRQPRAQEGYWWEVRVDGEPAAPRRSGDHRFDKPLGTRADIAVSSIRTDGAYSKPWVVSIDVLDEDQSVVGRLGEWEGVAPGPGVSGIETLRLASRPYLDALENQVYNDRLVPPLSLETSLDDFFGIGDIQALNPDPAAQRDWANFHWRGYEARILHGDDEWPAARFRRVATAMNGGCLRIADSMYRFDLIDAGSKLRRRFADAESVLEGPIRTVLDDMMGLASLPPITFSNVPAAALSAPVRFEVGPDTRVDRDVRRLAASIGVDVRTTAEGGVELFRPRVDSLVSVVLADADLFEGGARMSEELPAYSRVVVTRPDADPVEGVTEAITGDLRETLTVDSLLSRESDARDLLERKTARHGSGFALWEFDLRRQPAEIVEGAVIGLDLSLVRGVGTVRRVTREQLSDTAEIEVEVELGVDDPLRLLPKEPAPGRAPGPGRLPDAPRPKEAEPTLEIGGGWGEQAPPSTAFAGNWGEA